MKAHFGSLKRPGKQQQADAHHTGSFKLNFWSDSGNKTPSSGSLKRQAFQGGHPTLERHPSALWDARLPEGAW
jgi:hypothetical protein